MSLVQRGLSRELPHATALWCTASRSAAHHDAVFLADAQAVVRAAAS